MPDAKGKRVVLQCAGGVRSVRALEACQAAGLDITDHLAGGIKAWHAAGLPIVR
ncbi:rhodanese domain-containing protein [Asticcacaulis biprosthecium C19]|uniref:Rhodanese domain-containing protein n=1 Tax=Asticcacaulis biprosthecium C19 TaxID=715226 RepID=F4QTR4_9CAUL|nr:rhodanese domain-containing protein [Asticcacaulis biprosthecium C19]